MKGTRLMFMFYLLATAIAACAGFLNFFDNLSLLNSFGILECISAALLVYSCVGFGKRSTAQVLFTCTSSCICSIALTVLVCYLTSGASSLLLPMNLLFMAQTLSPFFIAVPTILCLRSKKDPATTAFIAIIFSVIFILVTNCLSIFVSYDIYNADAFEFYISDIQSEYQKIYDTQALGALAEKVYISFLTRMSVSLLPGILIMISVIQVFGVLFLLKLFMKDRIKEFHNGPWAVTLSTVSAIINIFCIVAFMSSFLSTSVNVFSAVAGNVMLILAPASVLLGFAFLVIGFHKGGFFNLIFNALPILMLFVVPPLAIIYISFIGSANLIFARITQTIIKTKQ